MNRVPFTEIDGEPYVEWWRERFAPDADIFAGMRFYQRGRSSIWVGSADIEGLSSTRMDAVGLHLLRIGRRFWKPTSTAVMAFGGAATINVAELDRAELVAFLTGEELDIPADDARRDLLTRGFIVARYAGVPVGCAEWHDRGALVSLIPKGQRFSPIDL